MLFCLVCSGSTFLEYNIQEEIAGDRTIPTSSVIVSECPVYAERAQACNQMGLGLNPDGATSLVGQPLVSDFIFHSRSLTQERRVAPIFIAGMTVTARGHPWHTAAT